MEPTRHAKLILEDGSVFSGYCFGSHRRANGEVVFNTGMVGYPETLTDPSYKGQILTLTYPLVGSYGVPGCETQDGLFRYFESEKIQVEGVVISDCSQQYSHWNAKKSLSEWLTEHDIPGIFGVDTRALTKKLRTKGTLLGTIVHGPGKKSFYDPHKRNLAAEVSIKEPITYTRGDLTILLVDCGTKNSLIRAFLTRGFTVKRVPWDIIFMRRREPLIL